MKKKITKTLALATLGVALSGSLLAGTAKDCTNKLFTVTIDNGLTIKDAVDNLAKTCGLTVIVKDMGAQKKLEKKLYYVSLNNVGLKGFLNVLLKDNDISYSLKGNKLAISYLITKTYKVHYVSGHRGGVSSANVQVAGGAGGENQTGNNNAAGSTISITSKDEFKFWDNLKHELSQVLNTAGDGSLHFTKVGNSWIGPDGQKWEYNPLEPVVNPDAGMVTVTGTQRQIDRVDRYIRELVGQIKTEVMIDVKILDVRLNRSKTTGIDWSKIYDTGIVFDGSYNAGFGSGHVPSSGSASFTFSGDLTGVMKFLNSQGDVTVVSSPKVMTLNNQPAMISVGKEIFYKLKTTNKVGGSDTATSEDETVRSVFAGILLDITPEVDRRGMVTLRINPSITALAESDKNRNLDNLTMPPNIQRRQISSVIKVKDGNHAVLGGLITKSRGSKVDKVPFLGDIPVLGHAFKRKENIDVVDELVIIITPHIVRDGHDVTLKSLGYKTLR